jgi:hypothetical protein
MKTIFNEAGYKDLVKRIESVQPGNGRKWGKMDAAQMLATVVMRCSWRSVSYN